MKLLKILTLRYQLVAIVQKLKGNWCLQLWQVFIFTKPLCNDKFKDYFVFCFRTSVLPSSHVESSFISDKISRSCFFGSVIKLAKFTNYDVVAALRCEFAVAKHQTFVRILYPFWFKDVTFESFSWGTGSNPVEACTLLGAFAIIAKIDCPPVRIKSLVEFHPRVKWNLFLQRKIVIRLPNILYLPYSIARRAWETLFFFIYLFFPALSFLRDLLFATTVSKLQLSWKCVLLALLFKSKSSLTTGLDNLVI